MLSTLHTPPFTWLESAIGTTAGSGGTYTAVSRHTAAAWGRVLDRVIVVPNGVDVHRWPAGAGGQYLVWFGRITPEKGTHLAIAAAERSGLRLILAGPVGNADYFRENFYITTSGNFRTQALIDAILEIGADRILFSADWPFENIDHASAWFDAATISEADRHKIGRGNAWSLFQLDRHAK